MRSAGAKRLPPQGPGLRGDALQAIWRAHKFSKWILALLHAGTSN